MKWNTLGYGLLLAPGVSYAVLTVMLFSSAVATGGSDTPREDAVSSSFPASIPESPEPPVTTLEPFVDREGTLRRLEEADKLSAAMCSFLTSMVREEECEKRELSGLADIIVDVVDEMSREGKWVPLGREKAPAFLAAWSYYEVSWRWRDPPVGASHGELGIFQMHGVARRFAPEDFQTNPYSSVRGAINYMSYLKDTCGGTGWARAYATGKCGEGEVNHRFELARRFLREMESM